MVTTAEYLESCKIFGYLWKYEDEDNSKFQYISEQPSWYRDYMKDVVMIPIFADDMETMFKALHDIVDRSHNGELGTSKVIDMRKIAEAAIKSVTVY